MDCKYKKKIIDPIFEKCIEYDDHKTKLVNKTVTKNDNQTKLVIITITKNDNKIKIVNKTVEKSCKVYIVLTIVSIVISTVKILIFTILDMLQLKKLVMVMMLIV